MTVCTVSRRVIAFLPMLFGHIRDGVFVASKAGVAGSGARMTGHTGGNWVVTMREREGMREGGRPPGCGGVTGFAVRPSLASVRIISP